MTRSTIQIEHLKPGIIIYSRPKNLIVPEVLTTQSLTGRSQRKDKHSLLVLTVNPDGAGSIIVTYISNFKEATSLVTVPLSDEAKQLLVPVKPATKEFMHEPVAFEQYPGMPIGC